MPVGKVCTSEDTTIVITEGIMSHEEVDNERKETQVGDSQVSYDE